MAPDDRIPPIPAISTDPVEPADAPRPTAPTRSTSPASVPRQQAPATTPSPANLRDPSVGSAAAHTDLVRGSLTPASLEAGTTVRDAASHGNAIARAIERAHPQPGTVLNVNDRAQQLGGAAASAGSGQGLAAGPRVNPPDQEQRIDPVDPLSPAARIGDDAKDGRERRRRRGAEPLPDDAFGEIPSD